MMWKLRALGALVLSAHSATAVELTLGNDASVKSAASTIAFGLMSYYTGNRTGDTPGNLPDPYFWWETGAMFGTMIDYWKLTGDTSYNEATKQALVHQAGDNRDFLPRNQSRTSGNDDQGFWAMAAMSAAENQFPDPPADEPQWLALAQAAFNQWARLWDEEVLCGGGLRWQINVFNVGYNYKNSISNGCFFNIAARLARFTGNQTYADWATKIFAWQESVGLITPNYDVYDGVTINREDGNCRETDQIQWSYNHGIYLHGAAVMYDVSGRDSLWKQRVDGILGSTINMFYNGTVMVEKFCEEPGFCDIDQRSFKGYLTRWMAGTTQMAPHTFDVIHPLLESSAEAAAKACTGSPAADFNGIPGTACGFKWTTGGFDGMVGVGEQMNALGAVMYTMINKVAQPLTSDTGGTSRGNPDAGLNIPESSPITLGERVAAGFLTTAVAFSVIGGSVFVML
ncbi:cell wall glycosyl hydrolase [Podospora aff. communis PSN243]|uniref:Mannan endo-1,6-alpha-mannosidase n=1 Tax=Podospora aff. communis PSN243 TaxID=3040156 RepID=A0AAV9GZI2_9PEZI|nr:cell wall glycosyl hydrolase [Podospora aff. communis PSN243]